MGYFQLVLNPELNRYENARNIAGPYSAGLVFRER